MKYNLPIFAECGYNPWALPSGERLKGGVANELFVVSDKDSWSGEIGMAVSGIIPPLMVFSYDITKKRELMI